VRVRWLRVAVENLNSEAEYIARDSPTAAGQMVQIIDQAVQRLTEYPALGRPGRVAGTRELVVTGIPILFPIVFEVML
jgi:toxin ParE1/3/4